MFSFFLLLPRPLRSTLFPYTTLFRSMTNFRDLKDIELEDLVSYVIFLSMRGNVEFEVMRKLLDPDAAAEDKARKIDAMRSEEHTSELQSRGHLVCRLLLEKKKQYSTE